MRGKCSIKAVLLGAVAACAVIAALNAGSALAAKPCSTDCAPWWHVNAMASPTNLPPGGQGTITGVAANLGDERNDGPVTVTDTLPAGVTLENAESFSFYSAELSSLVKSLGVPFAEDGKYADLGPKGLLFPDLGHCTVSGQQVTCTYPGAKEWSEVLGDSVEEAEAALSLEPYEGQLEIVMHVSVPASVSAENRVEVIGGGARNVNGAASLTISAAPTTFGAQSYETTLENEEGEPVSQAGAHPFQMTTTLLFNQSSEPLKPPGLTRNLTIKLPPGLVGNPTAFSQCPMAEFGRIGKGGTCPATSFLGVVWLETNEPVSSGEAGSIEVHDEREQALASPVINLEPAPGEPARLGFVVSGVPVIMDTSVRTGSDYGVNVSIKNISQVLSVSASRVTLWGTPDDQRHDAAVGCRLGNQESCSFGQEHPAPFLVMPTACGQSLTSSVEGESWSAPHASLQAETFAQVASTQADALGTPLSIDGCNQPQFKPEIKAQPDLEDAASPSGLAVDVHVPQNAALDPEGDSQSAVKEIEVALPAGMTVNPGGADGLTSCTEQQIGYQGKEEPEKEVAFEHFTPDYPSCPDSSKIATVTIHTPLLPHPIEGFVYLATPSINGEPGDNPYKSLIAMYLVAQDPVSGVLVKLPMDVSLNPTTGQLVTKVNNPELPFEDAELHFFGGSRAPLATPAMCGTYTTKAVFTPWSGNAPVDSNATFTIDTGPGGGSCLTSPRPFAPTFQAGTSNLQAGAYTPFTTTLGHPDGNQYLGSVSMNLPPGLMGSLSGVKLCPEPEANEGTCGPESLIGHTVVTAGLGSNPAVVARPGNVYITGPYNGHGACKVGEPGCAPFGLTIANPAETGPFDLEKGTPCDCVPVRAKVEVDPITAQLTVTSDPLPTILKGIPLQLQHVNVTIERPGFTFNPTNCAPLSINGTIASAEGAAAPVQTPFQVANCATLGFKPQFKVSTPGKTSRKNGAGLNVKLVYPTAPFGSQANIAKVKVDLPKQLPSRLTTLQKACLAATFEANPAACPVGSKVGFAKAITPVLPVPLEGPAYFVSYGNKKFPELIVVLQGYGVTVDLHGETFITNAGITTSTFRQVPDVPVGSFELKLPEGPYSALAANANLCKATYTVTANKRVGARIEGRSRFVTVKVKRRLRGMLMPTAFIAQNGMQIHTSTPIAVTGCASTHKVPKARKHRKKH